MECPVDCKTVIVGEDLLGHSCLMGNIFQKITRKPGMIAGLVPFSPLESSVIGMTIELCRLEIYSIVIEKAGLQNQVNASLEVDYMLARVERCAGSWLNDPKLPLPCFQCLFILLSLIVK